MVGGVYGSGRVFKIWGNCRGSSEVVRGIYESGRFVKIWENGRGSSKMVGGHRKW